MNSKLEMLTNARRTLKEGISPAAAASEPIPVTQSSQGGGCLRNLVPATRRADQILKLEGDGARQSHSPDKLRVAMVR